MPGLTRTRKGGVSLASGPVGAIGIVLLAYGLTGLVFGGTGFETDAVDGTVSGETWLGLEGNGWTNLLFVVAGALLIAASPAHWPAKTMALLVGLALGAASVIALFDGDDVLGIFAANGWTKLAWGVAALVLLALAVMPRIGRRREEAPPAVDTTPGEAHRLPSDRDLTARRRR